MLPYGITRPQWVNIDPLSPNDNLVWVTFCFCTGSYATAGCSLVHAITSEQLFRFLSFLVGLMDLTYRLPDKISVDFCRDLTLNFQGQIWNFAVSRPKMVRLPRNKSIHIDWTLSLKRDHRIWPWPCIFKVKYGIHYISAKNGPIAIKQTYRLNSKPQMWPLDLTLAMTLTLNFQGQIWNLLYLVQKWSDYHETKSKHIDWTLCLKCDHRIWPLPWPWIWIFKVEFSICFDCHKMKIRI